MTHILKSIAVAGVFVVASGSAQAQSPDAVMNRAVKAYTDMRSLRAEFTQKITNPLTGTTAQARGVLLRKDPKLLAINFTDPKGDRIISDGSSLWIYLPSSAPGQVVKAAVKGNSSMAMVDPAGFLLSSTSTHYSMSSGGTDVIAGRKMNVVSLIPKQSNGTFTRAKVWIDASSDMLRQFEVTDANGLTRLVTITSVQPNATISASEFRFNPPKNVRVLDSSAMRGM